MRGKGKGRRDRRGGSLKEEEMDLDVVEIAGEEEEGKKKG